MLLLSERMKEIKKQNQTIKQNNLFLKELINTIQHPVFYYSPKGLMLGFNDCFEQIMPRNMFNEENLHVYTLFIKDGADIHYEKDNILLEENEPLSYQADLTFNDNSIHHCIFNKAVFHDNDHKVQGIICVITDITELKEAHKKIVDGQKKELAGITMRLVQTCELNEKIIGDISELSKFTNRKGSDHIRKIISNYKIISNDALWKDFEVRFNEVYKDFYENLNKEHPNLTTNERKLCAFLKLNMSTKEIASITFQNPRSIDMARYRLRKKMQLSENENLIGYISSF
jgi:DNA-binding CsgD family transcriptional regulator